MRNTILKLALFITASAVAFGQPQSRLAPDLPDQGGEKVDVIIQFNEAPGQSHFNSINSGELKRKLPAIDGAVFSMPVNALQGLAHNPRIKYVSPDREVTASLDYAVPAVGADVAQSYGWVGTGVGVAVIDSGISDQGDLASRVVFNELGIHLTQVTPRCSVGPGGGLPARPTRIRVSLCERGGLPRLSVRLALARGFPLSKVWA